ncbi:hypothetical protein M422DRAFT_259328 [Sphaerobolus stellatus SS14]|uniref:Unplaced genomic scaffold SPHSTscaffold_88, whole genome shotgun sequence n=1 Tax=Sphaerobolus stellatus (strain SS14) TaxID=990650 RepID=A0A0C9V9E5_SPHS4|nr:hypothetical protein M422DRAFT_259328 [Sphaerobolus stellatus SS14]
MQKAFSIYFIFSNLFFFEPPPVILEVDLVELGRRRPECVFKVAPPQPDSPVHTFNRDDSPRDIVAPPVPLLLSLYELGPTATASPSPKYCRTLPVIPPGPLTASAFESGMSAVEELKLLKAQAQDVAKVCKTSMRISKESAKGIVLELLWKPLREGFKTKTRYLSPQYG